jgi:hypothetical protein
VLKDGTRLVTLGDVRAFILKEPKHIQERGFIGMASRDAAAKCTRFHDWLKSTPLVAARREAEEDWQRKGALMSWK